MSNMDNQPLTEILCKYAETWGLDPSEDDDLYDELNSLADDVCEKIEMLAKEKLDAE